MSLALRGVLTAVLADVFVLVFLAGAGSCREQSVLTGLVTDSSNGRPVEGVDIFLANTTHGTSSGADGRFELRKITLGTYILVFSKVGYVPRTASVEFLRPDSVHVEMALVERPITLSEVTVVARRPREWDRQLKAFVKAFLGRRENARKCVLLNPAVLDFKTDVDTGRLVASTDSVLRVENRALGYRLDIVLISFAWNTDQDFGRIVMYPRFTPIEAADADEERRWSKNREKTFTGSMTHFLSAVASGRIEDDFLVTANRERLVDSSLTITTIPGTSLKQWGFDGWLEVDFGGGFFRRTSQIRLNEPIAVIDSKGFLHTPLCFDVAGEWARYRVADMLPQDWR
jgi:hypothetical protein